MSHVFLLRSYHTSCAFCRYLDEKLECYQSHSCVFSFFPNLISKVQNHDGQLISIFKYPFQDKDTDKFHRETQFK